MSLKNSPRKKGIFIALEGPDGGGKSTQAKILREKLAETGRETLLVREPGGTPLGEKVREIILDPELDETGVRTELFLFMACRAQLVEEVIAPALKAGTVVLSDRFLLSTIVYQGIVGGLAESDIRSVANIATAGLNPDITLIFDVPASVGMARVGNNQDRIEAKGMEFHERIRQGYLDMAAADDKAHIIDATKSVTAIGTEAWEVVSHVLG